MILSGRLIVFLRLAVMASLIGVLTSCSHTNKKVNDPSELTEISGIDDGGDLPAIDENDMQVQQIPGAVGPDIKSDESDINHLPAEFNQNVEKWINYFQDKGRHHMVRYLGRSSRYIPKMKEIFKNHGLPEDLVYVALIESGFNPNALSRASAVGYWQFIRGTARRYGLNMNYYVDERRDFVRSTEAAALYLKALHSLFGSWYLAIASYNVGENRIKNMVMRHSTRNFWELARYGRLPRETIDYVPKFLAARLIGKHPEKYGFNADEIDYQQPLDFQELASPKAINLRSLASTLNVEFDVIQALNPAYYRGVIPKVGSRSVKVRVPSTVDPEMLVTALDKSSSAVAVKDNVVSENEFIIHRVRRGETLATIARKYGTNQAKIKDINNLWSSRLVAGRRIKVPDVDYGRIPASISPVAAVEKTATQTASSDEAEDNDSASVGGEVRYRVQRGDNVHSIAKRFGVSVASLLERNNLNTRNLIRAGKTLIIPSGVKINLQKSRISKTVVKNATVRSATVSKVHVVRRGDTLTDIAKKYNVDLNKLTQANRKLATRPSLFVGRQVVIPD